MTIKTADLIEENIFPVVSDESIYEGEILFRTEKGRFFLYKYINTLPGSDKGFEESVTTISFDIIPIDDDEALQWLCNCGCFDDTTNWLFPNTLEEA